jgi:hypothetical protein
LHYTPLTSPNSVSARTFSVDREPKGSGTGLRGWSLSGAQLEGTYYSRAVIAAARRQKLRFDYMPTGPTRLQLNRKSIPGGAAAAMISQAGVGEPALLNDAFGGRVGHAEGGRPVGPDPATADDPVIPILVINPTAR